MAEVAHVQSVPDAPFPSNASVRQKPLRRTIPVVPWERELRADAESRDELVLAAGRRGKRDQKIFCDDP